MIQSSPKVPERRLNPFDLFRRARILAACRAERQDPTQLFAMGSSGTKPVLAATTSGSPGRARVEGLIAPLEDTAAACAFDHRGYS